MEKIAPPDTQTAKMASTEKFASNMALSTPSQDTLPAHMQAANAQTKLSRAMEEDHGMPWKSWRGLQMILLIFVTCCCSGDNGYDNTVMSAINSMTQYQHYFGMRSAGAATGIVFGIYTIGSLASFFPASIIPDRFGRRWCMVFGNVCLLTGACITANAISKSMFIGGRFLTGFGCGTASNGAKLYLVELAPPHTRGRWLGLLNSFYYIGQILASGLTIPTGKMNSTYSWRIPIYIQAIPAVINLFTIMLFVESPRWLYSRGREEEAAKILAKYHTESNDINSPLVKVEMEDIKMSISLQGADHRFWDFSPLFKSRSDLWRSGMVLMMAVWGQFSGNGLVTYFLPVLLAQAGIVSPNRQRVLNFVNSVTSMVGALVGTAIIDHLGRRKLLLWGSVANVINMSIITGLLWDPSTASHAQAQAGIAFIFWFMVCFSFGFTAMQAVYSTEVLAFESRAKGTAFSSVAIQGISCINTFAMPVALDNIGSRTYMIFVVFDILGFAVMYFCAPETKNLSLEELDQVFDASNPVRYSLERVKESKRLAAGLQA